jgi:hypothetical protein
MKEFIKNQKKKFHPEFDSGRNLTSGEEFKSRKHKSSGLNKKRNPLSFVVPWQLSDEQD